MIFGFNTDVKYGDTVYHVQSEARKNDLLLQTQIFVRGRCIGKHATSYAEEAAKADFSDQAMHELLKDQHRAILEEVRVGNSDKFLTQTSAPASIQDASAHGHGLVLQWTNADAVYQDSTMVMKFQVTQGGSPVEGARLTSRLHIASDAPIYSQAVTDTTGSAEMKLFLDESAL